MEQSVELASGPLQVVQLISEANVADRSRS
jgi:hypothetical protein